jgi:squalene-hopene/tetraprenyl-beta-curcumene cyclase
VLIVTRWSVVLLFVALLGGSWAIAADTVAPDSKERDQMIARAIGYLQTKGQADDGSFSAKAGIGPTGLVAAALLKHGRTPSDPVVAKALAYLEKHVRDDGGIYSEGSTHGNYETCIAVMAFGEANKDGRYDELLANADEYLKHLQWGEKDGVDKSGDAYGGGGYGSHNRPDMSNTTFLIDALKTTGNDADSQAIQRALVFVSRCQNLESEHNTTSHAAKVNDGGFYYTVAAGGQSQAGNTEDGGLRSYGSMTYAGLKSMLYAGVERDDKRVQAALGWLKKHYTFEENPNMGQAGLYYYYHTLAKALDAYGQDKVADADGKQHDWKAELTATLAKRQQPDGSWLNETPRWMEGDPNLVTAYALLALSYCR